MRPFLTLDMLSRLKGIETYILLMNSMIMRYALDMLSRLKGIETHIMRQLVIRVHPALDMLSRLKGIETMYRTLMYMYGVQLWICFPV